MGCRCFTSVIVSLCLLTQTLYYPVAQAETHFPYLSQIHNALKSGKTFLRVAFIANDKEWPHVGQAIEEVEWALEPPTDEPDAGFFKKRLNTLKNYKGAFDLRRSFQNIRRLLHLSKDFESPWLRDLLITTATMLSLTHGTEFVTGVSLFIYYLLQLKIHLALAWGSIILPGFTDFLCHIGIGIIAFRPTRIAFTQTRKIAWTLTGRAADFLGVRQTLQHFLKREDIQFAIQHVLNNTATSETDLIFEIPDEELLKIEITNSQKEPVLTLQFSTGEENEVFLTYARIFTPTLSTLPYDELKKLLSPFGWNVLGAIRQIQKLLKRNQEHLIREERTFVSSVTANASYLDINFRLNSVFALPARQITQSLKCAFLFLKRQ